jgi:hypothetical protein
LLEIFHGRVELRVLKGRYTFVEQIASPQLAAARHAHYED